MADFQYLYNMKKEDNRDMQFRRLTMDNVRLSNEVARLESHVDFLTEENRTIETETREGSSF